MWSPGPWASCGGRDPICGPLLPTRPLEAAPHLTHAAVEVGANVGGWWQWHCGLHTPEVEEGVQVEALALAR